MARAAFLAFPDPGHQARAAVTNAWPPQAKRLREIHMKVLLLASMLIVSAAIAATAFAAEPFSEPSQLDQPQAGYYRLKIGKINVIAVSDGAAIFDVLGVIPK